MYKVVSCRVSFFAVADNVISGMGKGSVFKAVGDIELFQNIVIKTNTAIMLNGYGLSSIAVYSINLPIS